MKKKWLILLTLMLLLFCKRDVFAETILPTDVETADSGCTLMGIEGEYVTQIQDALNRINEIRYEACKEGVINPSTGQKLTLNDYVEIKWSSDLEYIARIRAAESSLTMGHSRTNGKSIWSLKGPNGAGSYGEVLAWNQTKSMVYAINQWYSEKSDWVNSTGGVTGHYTQMIDPENLYVGLGTFCPDSSVVSFTSTTAGEYSHITGLDETRGTATGICIQILEVQDSFLSGNYELKAAKALSISGDTSPLRLTKSGLLVLDSISWSSSDDTVISVDENGLANAIRCGSSKITAIDAAGHTASQTFTVDHAWSKWITVSKATVFQAATQERTCPSCKQTQMRTSGHKLKAKATLNASSLKLKTGQKTSALKISGMQNGDYVKSITSNKTGVVSVTKYTKSGSVTLTAGRKKGTATLTVTLASGLKKKVSVTVSTANVMTAKK